MKSTGWYLSAYAAHSGRNPVPVASECSHSRRSSSWTAYCGVDAARPKSRTIAVSVVPGARRLPACSRVDWLGAKVSSRATGRPLKRTSLTARASRRSGVVLTKRSRSVISASSRKGSHDSSSNWPMMSLMSRYNRSASSRPRCRRNAGRRLAHRHPRRGNVEIVAIHEAPSYDLRERPNRLTILDDGQLRAPRSAPAPSVGYAPADRPRILRRQPRHSLPGAREWACRRCGRCPTPP